MTIGELAKVLSEQDPAALAMAVKNYIAVPVKQVLYDPVANRVYMSCDWDEVRPHHLQQVFKDQDVPPT